MKSEFIESLSDEKREYIKGRIKVLRFESKCRFLKSKHISIPFKYRAKWFAQGFLSVFGYKIDYESRLNDARLISK